MISRGYIALPLSRQDLASSEVLLVEFLPVSHLKHYWTQKLTSSAVPAGGPVGEAVANYFTVRNGGVREPEFRLPAIAISVITAPLGLILYGAGLQYKLNFMVPIIGLGLGMKICKYF
jgi:hypothetical protein